MCVCVGVTPEMEILMQRRIYPFLLMVVLLIGILSFQIRQFKRLYEHIKNDKWVYFCPFYCFSMCLFSVIFFKWRLSLQVSGRTETCQLRTEIRKNKRSPALQPCCRVEFSPLLSHYVMFQLFFLFFFLRLRSPPIGFWWTIFNFSHFISHPQWWNVEIH